MKISSTEPTERTFTLEVTESELNALYYFVEYVDGLGLGLVTNAAAAGRFQKGCRDAGLKYKYPDMSKCFVK